MKIKITFLVVFSSLLLLSTYLFLDYKKYKNNLSLDIMSFNEQYSNFSLHYFDSQPKENKDIKKIIKWSKNTSNFKGFKILNLDKIIVKYNLEDKESEIFYSNQEGSQKQLSQLTFFDYLFKKKYKLLIGKFSKPIFRCSNLIGEKQHSNEVLLSRFELFKNEKSIMGEEVSLKNFYKQINSFEKAINNEVKKPRNLNILWFVYRNGKIRNICSDTFSGTEVDIIISKLEKHFKNVNSDYFDYSLFALRLFSSESSTPLPLVCN